MNVQWARKWVEALRSGEYKQTQGFLKDEKGYCCLGVLVKIAGDGCRIDDDGDWEANTILPMSVMDKVGMKSQTGRIYDEKSSADFISGSTLAMLNDNGKDFNEIADVIEANVDIL